MPIFIDKKGRSIAIDVDELRTNAKFEGEEIGFVTTTGLQDVHDHCPPMPAEITGWEVFPGFRRAGIATEMIRLLSEEIGMLLPGKRNIGNGGQNALTDEGESTVRYCQKLGYVYPFD